MSAELWCEIMSMKMGALVYLINTLCLKILTYALLLGTSRLLYSLKKSQRILWGYFIMCVYIFSRIFLTCAIIPYCVIIRQFM